MMPILSTLDHFDRLYNKHPDPWNVASSWYEKRKREGLESLHNETESVETRRRLEHEERLGSFAQSMEERSRIQAELDLFWRKLNESHSSIQSREVSKKKPERAVDSAFRMARTRGYAARIGDEEEFDLILCNPLFASREFQFLPAKKSEP